MEFKDRNAVLEKVVAGDEGKEFSVQPLSAVTKLEPDKLTLMDKEYSLTVTGLKNILKVFKIPFPYHTECSDNLKLKELLEGFENKKDGKAKFSFKRKGDQLYNVLPAAYAKHYLSHYAEIIMRHVEEQAQLYWSSMSTSEASFIFMYYTEDDKFSPVITISISEGDTPITIKGAVYDHISNMIMDIPAGALSEFKLSIARYSDDALRVAVNQYPPMIAAEVKGFMATLDSFKDIMVYTSALDEENSQLYTLTKEIMGREAVVNKMFESLKVLAAEKGEEISLRDLIDVYLKLVETEESPVPETILRQIPKFIHTLRNYKKKVEAYSGNKIVIDMPLIDSLFTK